MCWTKERKFSGEETTNSDLFVRGGGRAAPRRRAQTYHEPLGCEFKQLCQSSRAGVMLSEELRDGRRTPGRTRGGSLGPHIA